MRYRNITLILVCLGIFCAITKADAGGFILINGSAWNYTIHSNPQGEEISLDEIVRYAKIEFCKIIECDPSVVELKKLERSDVHKKWFVASFEAKYAIGHAFGINPLPEVKKSAAILVRDDGQIGKMKKSSDSFHFDHNKFVDWLAPEARADGVIPK